MNDNENLFFYGISANLIKFLGFFSMFVCAFFFLSQLFLISVIFFIIGITLIFKGSSMRFDFQRQSGYIIHKGDN